MRWGLTMALHNAQELDDDLGRRADEHLALAAALGVDNVVLRMHVSLKLSSNKVIDIPSSRSSRIIHVSTISLIHCIYYAQGQRRGPC